MASSTDPISVPIERYITQLLDEVTYPSPSILLQVSQYNLIEDQTIQYFSLFTTVVTIN